MMHNRRQFLQHLGGAAGGLWLGGLPGCQITARTPGQSGTRQRPNVLLIVVDDLNDWVGHLGGHPQASTPHLDRLATQGVSFTRAYCSSPLCGPSRAAFLSGMRASTTGVYDNVTPYHERLANAENLALCFRRHGYRTMAAGKVFHGFYPEYWDEAIDKAPRRYQAGQPKRNGTDIPGIMDWAALDCDDRALDDYRMAQFAVDRLQQEHDRPFFLACGLYRPHLPWYAPRRYFERYPLDELVMPVVKADDLDDIPPAGVRVSNPKYTSYVQASGKTREAVQAYLASVSFADAMVGRVLDAWRKSSQRDNTIVIVLGDNGLHLGEKQKWHKDSLWAEAARTPLLVVAPGVTPAGATCDEAVSLLDLYPTLAGLCDLDPPAHLEGHDLGPLLADPQRAWPWPAVVNRRRDQTGVRTRQWSYIRYDNGNEELYDAQSDPYEWVNLADRPGHGAVKQELAQWIPTPQAAG